MKEITTEDYLKLSESITNTKKKYEEQFNNLALLHNQLIGMNQESNENRKKVKDDPSYLSLKKTLIDMNFNQLNILKELIKKGTDAYYEFDEIEHLDYSTKLTQINHDMLNQLRINRDLLRRCLVEFDRFEKSIV